MEPADRIAADTAIARGVNWDAFLAQGVHHGVLPLVGHHLRAGAVNGHAVPSDRLADIHARNGAIARRNFFLAAELAKLLRAFADAGIRVVSLKGPLLAETVYGSLALRRISDLDLLCDDADRSRGLAVLRAQGFREADLCPSADSRSRARIGRGPKDVTVFDPTNTYRVELHRALRADRGRFRYDLDLIADGLGETRFRNAPVWAMCPEDLLVYLCMHGAIHTWERIEWLCGVAELLRSGMVRDWIRVESFARRLNEVRRLRAGLQTAHALLGAPAPESLLESDRGTRRAVHTVVKRLATNRAKPRPTEAFAYMIRTDDRWSHRVQRCTNALLEPGVADVRMLSLPGALWPMYRVLRPMRLAVNLVKRVYG